MKLTKAQFPDKEWPFTVDTVYVTSIREGLLNTLLIRFKIVRYALNGIAENYSWMPIPVRYREPNVTMNPGYYVPLTWFIKYCLDNVKKS